MIHQLVQNVAAVVDGEVRSLIENAHQEAFDILVANRSILDQMVLELLERETLNKEEIEVIFSKVTSWPRRPAWTGSIHRVPSSQPPVAIPEKKVVAEVTDPPKRATRKKKAPSSE
jgi:cell division protease FtsH